MTATSLFSTHPPPVVVNRVSALTNQVTQAQRPFGTGYPSALLNGGDEFDFADVFGQTTELTPHASTASEDADGGILSNRHVEELEEEQAHRLQDWAPPGSISDGRLPFIICNRNHSLVGPATTARLSLSRNPSQKVGSREDSSPLGLAVESKFGLSNLGAEARQEDAEGSSIAAEAEALILAEECSSSGHNGTSVSEEDTRKMGPDSFELLRVVGQGAFGKVFQVQQRDNGDVLAMKVMRKASILEKNQGDYMQAERDILTRVVHPFIVQLQYSFQTPSKLYLLLDFINGGHLFFQLYRQGTFSEDLARIYAAELVLAVGHLHSMGIMHRDLKPENILLDSDGHIKLTDFGLAKEFSENDKSNSLCGTMEYMAPEIIQAKGHGPAADFWSIGVLIFEMLTGQPPFSCNNRHKLQQKIIKEKIKFPSFLTSEAHSLLKGLLQKDPSKRLGSGSAGVAEVKSHKWFKQINWDKLLRREIQPKFRPTVNGKHCTANFDEMWTKMPVHDSPAGTPPTADLNVFRNYSYVAPHLHQLPTVESDSDGEAPSESLSPDADSESDTD